MILDELGARIEQCRAGGQGFALLFVDCAVVSRIDNAWGYQVGDAVRERFANKLRTDVLRAGDWLGLMRRDELACLLDKVHSPGVAMLAAEKVLRALDAPVLIGEDEVYARPAVGIALYPAHGEDAPTLLQHARTACLYTRERPERVAVFEEAQQRSEIEGLLFENRLRAAVAQEGLQVVYQPQMDLRSGLIVGIEGLLRWRGGELVPVQQAIAAAEAAGLVNEVTGWMLNHALRNSGEFRQSTGLDLRACVNLSAKSLRDRELPDIVSRAVRTWGLRPGRLVLEIAETEVLQASPDATATLRRLDEVGVRLSIDDIGSGFASLAYLTTLPFDEMKIHIKPVADMASVPQHLAMVKAFVGLAHDLRLEVVADGVADEAIAKRVKELGCDYMQGAVVGLPLDPQAFAEKFSQ